MTNGFAASRALPIAAALVLMTLAPRAAFSQARLHRFTLVVDANSGGAERTRLQYAVTDAERFARVLVELGDVEPANAIIRQTTLFPPKGDPSS